MLTRASGKTAEARISRIVVTTSSSTKVKPRCEPNAKCQMPDTKRESPPLSPLGIGYWALVICLPHRHRHRCKGQRDRRPVRRGGDAADGNGGCARRDGVE